jgi:membrane associated rhomboid family serine protease
MIVPYRCKNPSESFPFATISLIVVNVIVYLFTTNYLIYIKDGVVFDFAVSAGHFSLVRLLVSLFLHEQPFHLIGNMWFLWLFGSAVEGRLRAPKFLLIYFLSGIVGGLSQYWLITASGSDAAGLGAEGAIMGLAGAYIYMFPFARIVVFRIIILSQVFIGPADWMAWWVISYYVAYDVVNGLLGQAMHQGDLLSSFAHIGGFFAGLLCVVVLRARRDSELVSQAQALKSDFAQDLDLMTLTELESIVDAGTEDLEVVLAYCAKAQARMDERWDRKAYDVINRYKEPLIRQADSVRLAEIILKVPITVGGMAGPYYLRLGGKLELLRVFDTAAYVYRRAYDLNMTNADGGAALMRLTRIWEQVFFSPELAKEGYTVYIDHFPGGPFIEDAEKGLARVNQKITIQSGTDANSMERKLVPKTEFTLLAEEEEGPGKAGSENRPFTRPDLDDKSPKSGS